MDGSFSSTVLRIAGLACDTAIKLGAMLVGGTLLVVIAATNPGLLLPALGIAAGGLLLWRPLQALAPRGQALDPSERALLERRLRLLEDQVQLLQQEQTYLHATLHWQEELLERLAGERVAGVRG
jgi:hypothetical protein